MQVSPLACLACLACLARLALAAAAGGGLGLLAGCAPSSAVRAAERGDFASLQKQIAAEERLGKLSNGEAAALARAVAEWEVTKGPPLEQLARVREIRACARELDGALSRRMKTVDAAGAEAALARIEAGEMSEGDARAHVGDTDDAWRAVGARGLVRDSDAPSRQRAFVDPAPAVRRAAMHAGVRSKDPRDVDSLAEAARVDPEPIVRTDAVRALATIGGPAVVAKLRELWDSESARGDEPLREDIASAWASPSIWAAGGREELRVLLAQAGGAPAIQAAGAVLRGTNRDMEIDAFATGLLARLVGALSKASHRDRVHAIVVTPRLAGPGPLLDALRDAAKDPDVLIKIAALAHLLESPPDREASLRALEAIAGDKDRAAAASRARLALATAGDARVQAWLEADLGAADASTRAGAATALAALGRSGRAAPLLADADPSVRTRAACTLLLAPRR